MTIRETEGNTSEVTLAFRLINKYYLKSKSDIHVPSPHIKTEENKRWKQFFEFCTILYKKPRILYRALHKDILKRALVQHFIFYTLFP